MRPTTLLLALCLPLASASAQTPRELEGVRPDQAQPIVPIEAWSAQALRVVTDDLAVERMVASGGPLVLEGVPMPDGQTIGHVDLELQRFRFVRGDIDYRIDGQPAGGAAALEEGFSAWRGSVAGEPGSDVFLTFSRSGTRGWLERPSGKVHVIALDPAGLGEVQNSSMVIHEADPLMQANLPEGFACGVAPGGGLADAAGDLEDPFDLSQRALPPKECRLALETDFQFFQLFGDAQAASDYAMSLIGAVSLRYDAAANTLVTLSYLGIYTNSNDPWQTQDTGGGSGALLDEFSNAWRGQNWPANTDLSHIISGAGLGGGVATLGTVCNPFAGFAVSGNLHGLLSFPVTSGNSLNWDFVVVAHEIGHNMSSPHTHDYCPPIDQCYPGVCSSGGNCVPGTIMSYCHLCGGMANVQTHFASRVSQRMRNKINNSCLQDFDCTGAAMCPTVTQVTPSSIEAYGSGSRTITLSGQNFATIGVVEVDGQAIEDYTIVSGNTLTIDVPLLTKTGPVDVKLGNRQGVTTATTVTIDPVSTPLLELHLASSTVDYVLRGDGLPMTLAAAPGDLVWLMLSTSNLPSVLPGTLGLSIGNGFSDLLVLDPFPMVPASYLNLTLPLIGLPSFTQYWFQAAVLTPSGLPLVSTGAFSATVIL